MKTVYLKCNGFDIEIKKEKDLHMEGKYIVIWFEDNYQAKLVENYGWNENQAEDEVAQVLEKHFRKNGLDCRLIWEDREVFLIENPSFTVQDVEKVFHSLFHNSKTIESGSTGFISKLLKSLGIKK